MWRLGYEFSFGKLQFLNFLSIMTLIFPEFYQYSRTVLFSCSPTPSTGISA